MLIFISAAECITTSGENGFCVQAYLCDMDVERFNKSCPSPEKPCCLRLEDDEYSDSSEDATRQMCGWSQPNGIGVEGASTIGGQQDTKFGEFPWMVVITRAPSSNPTHVELF
ncbi:jg2463 [Pararge aegeria aegeria]|uniref:Jg2463 protein n=1 Tax=Pararge aegeria aegeria TaxID=348720 RepID=A0A8S4QRG2_9NEOP|nr:jg2463 [Pararge aegeria aegeria]